MPVYTCNVRPGDMTAELKAEIAREITRIHCDVTGAPTAFVQVFFREVLPGDGYVGGEPFAQFRVIKL
ncbi:MAG: tautomerase family protein [Acidimicrobiia bacterium]